MNKFLQMILCILSLMAWRVQPLLAEAGETFMDKPRAVVFSFEPNTNTPEWYSIDDRVMGGVSRSNFEATNKGLGVFNGTLSLQNNGGFASVRVETDGVDLSGFDAITIRVRGDGRTYKFCLKTDDSWDGILYQSSFKTKAGKWQEISLPLESFQPMWRGRLIREAGSLSADQIRSFGLMLADKNPGEFKLELDWIAATSENPVERGRF